MDSKSLNLLDVVPAVLLNDWLMCAIDDFTLCKRDILSFLGTHGLGRSFRHDKVSCIDWFLYALTLCYLFSCNCSNSCLYKLEVVTTIDYEYPSADRK